MRTVRQRTKWFRRVEGYLERDEQRELDRDRRNGQE